MTTMTPQCPIDYSCTFAPIHPRVITRIAGPWWRGGGGLVVAIVGVICIACVLIYLTYIIAEARQEKHNREERELERKHKTELEEQRTYQADIAKGNPEVLREIRRP